MVGGGGRVSHLVIPEPPIDYPSFLCLSGRPVKSGGVTQTNRSVFQSVRSREYLSRDCSDSAVSSAGHLDVKRATGRCVILRTKNSLVWSKLATESARKTEFWFRFGRHTHWWPAAGVLWQESILSFVASRRGRSGPCLFLFLFVLFFALRLRGEADRGPCLAPAGPLGGRQRRELGRALSNRTTDCCQHPTNDELRYGENQHRRSERSRFEGHK